jgi:hypothetical protein
MLQRSAPSEYEIKRGQAEMLVITFNVTPQLANDRRLDSQGSGAVSDLRHFVSFIKRTGAENLLRFAAVRIYLAAPTALTVIAPSETQPIAALARRCLVCQAKTLTA